MNLNASCASEPAAARPKQRESTAEEDVTPTGLTPPLRSSLGAHLTIMLDHLMLIAPHLLTRRDRDEAPSWLRASSDALKLAK